MADIPTPAPGPSAPQSPKAGQPDQPVQKAAVSPLYTLPVLLASLYLIIVSPLCLLALFGENWVADLAAPLSPQADDGSFFEGLRVLLLQPFAAIIAAPVAFLNLTVTEDLWLISAISLSTGVLALGFLLLGYHSYRWDDERIEFIALFRRRVMKWHSIADYKAKPAGHFLIDSSGVKLNVDIRMLRNGGELLAAVKENIRRLVERRADELVQTGSHRFRGRILGLRHDKLHLRGSILERKGRDEPEQVDLSRIRTLEIGLHRKNAFFTVAQLTDRDFHKFRLKMSWLAYDIADTTLLATFVRRFSPEAVIVDYRIPRHEDPRVQKMSLAHEIKWNRRHLGDAAVLFAASIGIFLYFFYEEFVWRVGWRNLGKAFQLLTQAAPDIVLAVTTLPTLASIIALVLLIVTLRKGKRLERQLHELEDRT